MTEAGSPQLKTVRVTTAGRIEELVGLIHDEYFCLADVRYNTRRRSVEIPYRRIFHDGPRSLVRKWFFYKLEEVDVIRAVMRVDNVDEYEVRDRSRIGTYSFNTIKHNQATSTLVIRCNEGLDLRMRISGLLVESRDVEVRGKSGISCLLGFIESPSAKVYE